MKNCCTAKKWAFTFSIIFIISTFCAIAINSDFQQFLGHASSGPWEDTYPHTYKALVASIAFDAYLVAVIVGFWYFLINNELSRYYLAYAIVAITYGVVGRLVAGIVYLVSPDAQNLHDTMDAAFDQIHHLDRENIPAHLRLWKASYGFNIAHLVIIFVIGGLLKYSFVKNMESRKRLIAK